MIDRILILNSKQAVVVYTTDRPVLHLSHSDGNILHMIILMLSPNTMSMTKFISCQVDDTASINIGDLEHEQLKIS